MKKMKSIFCLVALLSLVTTTAVQAQSHSIGKGFVDMLVKPYLEIQQGLAGDDLSSAQSGAKSLLNMTGHGHFSGDAKTEVEELIRPVVAISNASSIAAAREEFQDLSQRLTALIKRVGTSGGTNLYLAKCPMAFGGQGGTWIQDNEKIANPYYGSQMYGCGGVQEQIAGGKSESSHSGHDHGAMVKPASDYGVTKLDAVHADVPGYHSSMGHNNVEDAKVASDKTCQPWEKAKGSDDSKS